MSERSSKRFDENKEKKTNVLFNFEIKTKTKFNFYDIKCSEASSLCNPKRYQSILIQLKINKIKKRLKKSILKRKKTFKGNELMKNHVILLSVGTDEYQSLCTCSGPSEKKKQKKTTTTTEK